MKKEYRSGIICLTIVIGLFVLLGTQMGAAPMLNTVMKTAHDLLLNTCFYLNGHLRGHGSCGPLVCRVSCG